MRGFWIFLSCINLLAVALLVGMVFGLKATLVKTESQLTTTLEEAEYKLNNLNARNAALSNQLNEIENQPVTVENRILESLRVQELIVVGDKSEHLLEVGSDNNSVYQLFRNPDGGLRLKISVEGEGDTKIVAYDQEQRPRLALAVSKAAPGIVLLDSQGTRRAGLLVEDRASTFVLAPPTREDGVLAISVDDYRTGFIIIDANEKPLMGFGNSEDGSAFVVYDSNGVPRIATGIDRDGWGFSYLMSADGYVHFGIRGKSLREFGTYLYRAPGQVAWANTTNAMTAVALFDVIRKILRR